MKMGLRGRLFFSHLVVMIVGVASLVSISKISSPRLFVLHLEGLENQGFDLIDVRAELVTGFELAWQRSTIWSVLVGTTAAGGLSYWVSRRIMQRLTEMEQITQKFAAGQMDARLPVSDIPELSGLSASFNRMAASLEGVEARRREVIGDMTHELRTPLTVVRGYLEELADGEIEASPEIYRRLAKETRRLERLVNDLQELSKAEAGYLPINIQRVNLYPLLESLVEKFTDQLLEDGPVMLLQCPSVLPPVLADIDRTEQVLVNLLGNAVRYTNEGSITITVGIDASQLWIAVSDTGIGIAPENLPHVFERFWRADQSRDRHSGGTGIGLTISRRLIELQGGQIQVESELKVGSTFRFFLPLA
ncbi:MULTISPECIES: HAMP domain-containing sensor histidine kinase [unclassified Nostoc]|uniref:sensor histidine kinase n=1 Tax=unclassified Nostoc TaxID=2593658 RepID=UPI0025AA8E2F|nr:MULTISPECIES: HAMP domain-containing sensor histidine kinase [unclassified Nostoc]MDM9580841.1 HAMP domain-containing sensor histidine kinase [Nostoc sp. GT001]MDZ7948048.1 HAMP domain-containing sensor histidine kinase [Nostoc sp. EfeVER01]MDZ7995115.1 HAMP domain-containing sensor histidine kinase [Nostoc sp. EspVER01]